MGTVKVKRVYDPPAEDDGWRVLVDRLWPRGLKKESAAVDLWLKAIAPETGLRKWFNHDPEKWAEFSRKYRAELKASPVVQELLEVIHRDRTVTLLYGAKDEKHNQAVVLQQYVKELLNSK
jgi:uncharacterized protein YeaO (DUF488 family)